MTILETSRLIIRNYNHTDARLVMEYSQENRKRCELPEDVFQTIESAADHIKVSIENDAKDAYPLSYAIALKESNVPIGEVQLCTIKNGIEISYSISENYAGNGYATEAVKAFSKWAKDVRRIDVIYGFAKESNRASWRVLESAGFSFLYEKPIHYYGQETLFKVYSY
jgi:ribosomal-protein-alanine N-acetyltransferase